MAKNRRSGKTGDIAGTFSGGDAQLIGEDKAELLAELPADVLPLSKNSVGGRSADSKPSEELQKPKRTRKGAAGAENKVPEETEKPKRTRKSVAGAENKVPEETEKPKRTRKGAAEGEVKVLEEAQKPKRTRKSAAGAENKVPEETEKPKRTRKSAPEAESKVSEEAQKPKRTRKSAPEAESKVSEETDAPAENETRGLKTPQVMKLIEGDDENLVIMAGKSRVPNVLRGRESLSSALRRGGIRPPAEDMTEVVNITELAIEHEAPEILDRFNACSCEKCVKAFSEIISARIPVRYARISKVELMSGELPERALPMRKVVLSEMIKELIGNKKRCFHDE